MKAVIRGFTSAGGRRWAAALGLALALLGILWSPETVSPEADVPPPPDLASLVRPLAGTQRGGVFPGATTPFGMVGYSPNTDGAGGGGYGYGHPRTWGFAATHLSGPGCAAMGDVVSLPTTGEVKDVDVTRQKSRFSHATELASPGYYAVDLDASRVHAELTATARSGLARFTYPGGTPANVIIDPGSGFRGVRDSSVRVVGANSVEGWVSSWGFWHHCPIRGPNRYRLYFSMRFERPFSAFGTGNGSRIHPGRRAARGVDAGAYVSFDPAVDARPLVSEVAVSYVDVAGARRNLLAETGGGFDFDGVRARAREGWNEQLGRVRVVGGPQSQLETFYTALYHALLSPSLFSDADGRYVGFDDRVHRLPGGQAHYTNFSMWDTYRSEHQLIDLVAPERVGDMMRSLLDDQRQAGWIPKWPYAHFDTNEMVGDPAANVIADALLKGLARPEDVVPAFNALVHNATDVPAHSPFEGRTGLDDYVNRGFVTFRHGDDHTNAASINMEYALNDCALALVAGRLGREADSRYLLRRAKRYRSTIDPSSHFARPRRNSGSWLRPFSARSSVGFKEGSAWHYTWLAPQDVPGLTAALGGRSTALARLDRFFDYDRIAADLARARFVWHGPSRYNPHNETDIQAPYLYDYLGQPWKTQDVVRAAETLFSTEPRGLPGSDDLGAMSSWYVMSALGLYPATAGDDHYALTSPLFDHAELSLPRPPYSGGPLVIDAPGAAAGLRHVRGVSLDGAALSTSEVSHGDLARGAHLEFTLAAAPDPGWATGARVPSSPCAANPRTADVRLHLAGVGRSRRAARVRATLRNEGDDRADGLRVTLRAPRGWSAGLISGPVRALGPGDSATQTWLLRPHGGRRRVRVRADARWSGPGGPGDALRTFAKATARAGRR